MVTNTPQQHASGNNTGLNGQRWIRMLSESIVTHPRYAVCVLIWQCAYECFRSCAVIKTKKDIYLYKLDDVMFQTERGKGEQMVSCLSVSINVISRDHIWGDGAPAELTAEMIWARLSLGLVSSLWAAQVRCQPYLWCNLKSKIKKAIWLR